MPWAKLFLTYVIISSMNAYVVTYSIEHIF
jgi:hypothetical protein